MNGHVVWLLVAMVSVGLVGSMVTRQQERVLDKGSWCEGEVWGRCECMRGEVGRGHREDKGESLADTVDRTEEDRRRDRGRDRDRQTERRRGRKGKGRERHSTQKKA